MKNYQGFPTDLLLTRVNKISLNTPKAKFIQFQHKQNILNENNYLKLRSNDFEIEQV